MKEIRIVRISKKPDFIVVTEFEECTVHYHLFVRGNRSIPVDVGIWIIKYKPTE